MAALAEPAAGKVGRVVFNATSLHNPPWCIFQGRLEGLMGVACYGPTGKPGGGAVGFAPNGHVPCGETPKEMCWCCRDLGWPPADHHRHVAHEAGFHVVVRSGDGNFHPSPAISAEEAAALDQAVSLEMEQGEEMACPASFPAAASPPSGWKALHPERSKVFHCGFRGLVETKLCSMWLPCLSCVYDDAGALVDEGHECAGCRGNYTTFPLRDWATVTFLDHGSRMRRGEYEASYTFAYYRDGKCRDVGVFDVREACEDLKSRVAAGGEPAAPRLLEMCDVVASGRPDERKRRRRRRRRRSSSDGGGGREEL